MAKYRIEHSLHGYHVRKRVLFFFWVKALVERDNPSYEYEYKTYEEAEGVIDRLNRIGKVAKR